MNGKLILDGSLFRARKSGHMCQAPSFFNTITTREEYGLVLGRITPASSNSCTIFSIPFFWQMDTSRDIHWGLYFPEGEGCYDHAHPWREGSLLESQIPLGTYPILVAG
jgi:hypothetical protein